ncbi:MAG: crotonase/enoyl-CoA hydratase family protein [Bacteroidetes bacterium]|nr:MAG: crotonase/enoyl-CoA hydratase family protein [Bacteroidota bacterium]
MDYTSFSLSIENHIAEVRFNRPDKANALHAEAWEEMRLLFRDLAGNSAVRVVILSGEGHHFCAGIDLTMLMSINQDMQDSCEGRKRERLRRHILYLQDCIQAIEDCPVPVLAAIHGGCIGGGLDIISACDMRYAAEGAYFTVKEVDMGMVADLGTLQRLPKLIPDGMAREMAYTGRKVAAQEAQACGLVNQVYPDQDALYAAVHALAVNIAAKSPLSIRGSKEMLVYARDHSVADGLNYIATWNAAMILSEDLATAFQASLTKKPPIFRD